MLIVLTGTKGSGKDTVASELSKQLNLPTYAFADPVKIHLCQLIGWGRNMFERRETKEELFYSQFISFDHLDKILEFTGNVGEEDFFLEVFKEFIFYSNNEGFQLYISPRKAMQMYGTNFARALNDLEWINRAPKENCIITDGRFSNEVESAKSNGAICVEVVDPNIVNTDTHESEKGVDKELVDVVYYNNKSGIDKLKISMEVLVKKLKSFNCNKNVR